MRRRLAKLLHSYAKWLERDHKWSWTFHQIANRLHNEALTPTPTPVASIGTSRHSRRGRWR